MRTFIGTAVAAGIFFLVSSVFANPAMLPKHPGYPIGDPKSPVNGQKLANDTGQTNAYGDSASVSAAGAATDHAMQKLMDPNNKRLKKSTGAGRLPQVTGPEFFSEPPVKKGTIPKR